jgi:cysteine sulfinate desulfinase/cysteine desulfurase-like protein
MRFFRKKMYDIHENSKSEKMKTIYLDNNAMTAISPEVLNEMLPYLKEFYGNPSSIHSFGRNLYYKIEQAREKVALLIGAEPEEIIFTSCGTESGKTAMVLLKAMFATGAMALSSVSVATNSLRLRRVKL